jgi:hypothetical protein
VAALREVAVQASTAREDMFKRFQEEEGGRYYACRTFSRTLL